jgi:hypothetical protein
VRPSGHRGDHGVGRRARGDRGGHAGYAAGRIGRLMTADTRSGVDEAHHQRLNERLRRDYIAGAEEECRRRSGRPMTAEELEQVLRRYPGDV